MKIATVSLAAMGTSAYSQGRHYTEEEAPKLPKESPGNYEKRTWRHRMHYGKDGMVFIPPMALKNCLSDAAKFLSIKIPGKGQATYTKHFDAGVLCMEPASLGIHKDDVAANWLFLPSDGTRGGNKRVDKCFGVIYDWSAVAAFYVADYTITEDVFKDHLVQAGTFIGLGVFRPRNGGYQGRFVVNSIEWSEQ